MRRIKFVKDSQLISRRKDLDTIREVFDKYGYKLSLSEANDLYELCPPEVLASGYVHAIWESLLPHWEEDFDKSDPPTTHFL